MIILKKRRVYRFYTWLVLFLFIFLILQPQTTVLGYDKTHEMAFGSMLSVWNTTPFGPDKDIVWSFSGSQIDIDVKVAIMDSDTYQDSDQHMSSQHLVSDGTKSSDKGRFHIPHEDTWYILFYITDLDGLFVSTFVNVKVDFVDESNLALILGLSIGIPGGLGIIALILVLFLVVLPKRIAKVSKETPTTTDDEIFCWKCGSKNPSNQRHCGDCGIKLAKE